MTKRILKNHRPQPKEPLALEAPKVTSSQVDTQRIGFAIRYSENIATFDIYKESNMDPEVALQILADLPDKTIAKVKFLEFIDKFKQDIHHPVYQANEYQKYQVLMTLFKGLGHLSSHELYCTYGHENLAKLASNGSIIYVVGSRIPEFLASLDTVLIDNFNDLPENAEIVYSEQDIPVEHEDKKQYWTNKQSANADICFLYNRSSNIKKGHPVIQLLEASSGYPLEFVAENIADISFNDGSKVEFKIENPSSQPEIFEFVKRIYNLSSKERVSETITYVYAVLNKSGLKGVAELIKEIGRISWYLLYKSSCDEQNYRNLRTVLDIQVDLYTGIKNGIIGSKSSESWRDLVYANLPDISNVPLSFTTAGLPHAYPIVERFKVFFTQLMQDPDAPFLGDDKAQKEQLIRNNFIDLSTEVFPRHHVYQTYSTTNSFQLLWQKVKMPAKLILDEEEYLPFLECVPREDIIICKNPKNRHSTSQNIFYSVIQNCHENMVVLSSSTPRNGNLKHARSVPNTVDEITQQRKLGKEIEYWVDASQDARLFGAASSNTNPDLLPDKVFFSKRLGDSGRGIVVSKSHCPQLESHDYPIEFVAANFASLYALYTQSVYTVEDLLKQPAIVDDYFEIYNEQKSTPDSNKVLRFCIGLVQYIQSDKFSIDGGGATFVEGYHDYSSYSPYYQKSLIEGEVLRVKVFGHFIKDVAKKLQEEQGVTVTYVDSYSWPEVKEIWADLDKLSELDYSGMDACIEKIHNLDQKYMGEISHSFSGISGFTPKEIQDKFLEVIYANCYLRVRFTAFDHPHAASEFVRRLNLILDSTS